MNTPSTLPPHINRHVVITGIVQTEAVRLGSNPADRLSTEDVHRIGQEIADELDGNNVEMAHVHALVRAKVDLALQERKAAVAQH
ncbi:MAG: hypothetical protein WCX29_03675 [Candidatus Peribacteraceae bacterium]|nr:hypothetical protein [Candidatus Peribacteria bacterium]